MATPSPRTEQLTIKLDGNLNEIDVDTFFNSIIPFTATLQEIERVVNPDAKLGIKIRAPQRGSFEILMLFDQSIIDTLFSKATLTTIASVVSIIGGMIAIRKHLRGEPAKKVSESDSGVVIENSEGQSIFVDNRTYSITVNNPVANDSLDKMFNTLNHDTSIDTFEISQKRKTLLRVHKDEFSQAAKSVPTPEDKIKREVAHETVTVFKVVFEEKYKWEFYLKGHKFSANIEDKSFFKRIDDGEEFAKGDRLTVDLEITKVYDESVKDFVIKHYTIKKVYDHSAPDKPEQLSIT